VHTPAPEDASTVNTTGLPDPPPVAVSAAECPAVPVAGAVKLIACAPWATVIDSAWLAVCCGLLESAFRAADLEAAVTDPVCEPDCAEHERYRAHHPPASQRPGIPGMTVALAF
jgi:hypothetical protein